MTTPTRRFCQQRPLRLSLPGLASLSVAVCTVLSLPPAAAQTLGAPQGGGDGSAVSSRVDASQGTPPLSAVEADAQELYLEVSINQADAGQLVRFLLRNDAWQASAASLRELGLQWPGSEQAQGLVNLAELPGVSVEYDAAAQHIALTVPAKMLAPADNHVGFKQPARPRMDPASRVPGAILNYDLYGQQGPGYRSLSGFTELRLFGVGPGIWSNTLSTRWNDGDAAIAAGQHDSVRLDTTWQWDMPDAMVSVTAGDALTSALDWSRATRIGGIRVSRNFSLQPYRITTPLASFAGQAALPSTVDLYIDGLKQSSEQVRPGQFQIDSVPALNGVGQAQVVITDINGQSRSVGFSLYGTPELLEKGLTDWSLEAGVVREDYGLRSFAYGNDPMFSATGRYGLTDRFTIEGHSEANKDLQQAGLGGVMLLGRRGGVLGASLAASRGDQGSGHQYGLGYQWAARTLSTSLGTLRRSDGFQDVASLSDSPLPRRTDQAYAGVSTPFGQWGVSYVAQYLSGSEHSRYATLSWTRQLPRNSTLSVNFNRDLENNDRDSAYVFWSVPLDRQTSISSTARHGSSGNSVSIDASRTVPSDLGGWGWRAQASAGDTERGQAQVTQLGRYGQWTAGVDYLGGQNNGPSTTTAYAGANGGISLMQGHLYAMRRVDDAFALVSTDGVAQVPVRLENRIVGQTDENGLLLINRLNAWQDNRISIDTLQLPIDMQVQTSELDAVPRSRSGMLAHFPMRRTLAVQLALTDAAGQWIAAGSSVSITSAEGAQPASTTVVGHDGLLYLEDPAAGSILQVHQPDGACSVALPALPAREGRIDLGTLQCK